MKVPMPERPMGDWRRTAAWVAGAVLVAWLACFRFPMVWVVTGIGEPGRPFMDLYGILAACDAAKAGVDPFLPNNFDPYHRPHVYTTWWLGLGHLGLGRADTAWLGSGLLVAVLLAALVMARPRQPREGLGLVLILVSPAFLMAVNRANNDLVVFVLMSIGLLCFRREAWPLRTFGVLLFALSAVLKYYPLVTLVVLFELRSRRQLAGNLALYGLLLLLAWPGLEPGLKSAARHMPQPDWLYAFGAPVFWRNLGIPGTLVWLVPAVLLAGWGGLVAWRQRPGVAGAASPAEREFILGAATLLGMFFLGSSFAYKLVFVVWLLPWLWQQHTDGTEARWARVTWALLLAVVWLEGMVAVGLNLGFARNSEMALSLLKAGLTVAQLVTWAWIACLVRCVLVLLARSLRAWWVTIGPAKAA
jgi:hypothetical protein